MDSKPRKYTKDELVGVLLDYNERSVKVMTGLEGALTKLNDQNILHSQVIENNSNALKEMAKVNKTMTRIFITMMFLMLAALIVLAGAEKAFKFMPLLK